MKNDEEEDDDEGNESEAEGAQLLNVGTGDPSISESVKKRTAARKVMPKMEDLSSQLRTHPMPLLLLHDQKGKKLMRRVEL